MTKSEQLTEEKQALQKKLDYLTSFYKKNGNFKILAKGKWKAKLYSECKKKERCEADMIKLPPTKLVIDRDNKEYLQEILNALEDDGLNNYYVTETPRGYHIILDIPELGDLQKFPDKKQRDTIRQELIKMHGGDLAKFSEEVYEPIPWSLHHKDHETIVKIITEKNGESKLPTEKILEALAKEEEKKYKELKLTDLDANLIDQYTSIDCQITGEQSQKAIPGEVEITCKKCGKTKTFYTIKNPDMYIGEREIKTVLNELKEKFMCDCPFNEEKPYKTCEIKSYMDFAILFVRDLLHKEDLSAVKRYESKRVYIINQKLPITKTVNIKGKVIIEPKTKNLSIICNKITPLKNQIEQFKITEQFKENSKQFNPGENLYDEINPDIVGKTRELAKESIILQLHSPCRIPDIERKKIIRGGLNIVFFGDTKTAKTELAKDVTNEGQLPVGEYTTAETGTRTGLLYTIDKDKNALTWGSIPLNDMGLVVLDGLQAMHSEELGQFRESMELHKIIVKRSISGEALARTRILSCMNPNKPMNQYIYRCQAIQDSYVFQKTPEVTRWDLFLPFSLKDVPSKEVQDRTSKERPVPIQTFLDHIYWAWSRKPENITYTEPAIKKIKECSSELVDEYSLEALPIIHNGVRDTITRLSTAYAVKTHSTNETHENIIVETEHVENGVKFLKRVLEVLELSKYKQDLEGKSHITDNECIAISKELGEVEFNIIESIKHEPKSSTQLSAILDLAPNTVKEHYNILKKHNLVQTKTGVGIELLADVNYCGLKSAALISA